MSVIRDITEAEATSVMDAGVQLARIRLDKSMVTYVIKLDESYFIVWCEGRDLWVVGGQEVDEKEILELV